MLNHITLMGRLTKDPELRRTGSGIPVASFRIAVDRDYQSKDSEERKTDFIDCVAWRNTGEFISKYFTKGRMIVVDGRLEVRDWTDKEGHKRTSAEVIVENAYFGDSKKEDTAPAPQYGAPQYGGQQGAQQPQYGAPQGGYPQYGGYAQPPQAASQYSQQGFGGYQQPSYPQQQYQPPQPQYVPYAPLTGEDPNLPEGF